MRATILFVASALVLAACSQAKPQAAATPPAAPAAPPPESVAATPAPAPEAPVATPAEAAASPAAAQEATPQRTSAAGPTVSEAARWREEDARRERRLAALIANAESRDGSGETQQRVAEGRYRRAHCGTRACVNAAYAAEEAWLRQWEGSGDAR